MNPTSTVQWLRQRKHRLLLLALIFGMLLQPVATAKTEVVGFVVLLAVFLTVFERRVEQVTAIVIVIPAIVLNTLGQYGPEAWRDAGLLGYHGMVILFMGFAVATILSDIFGSTRIQIDHVIGAFSGFILAALAWANLYMMIYLIDPTSFRIDEVHSAQINDIQMRRFLFDHLSIASLTTLDHDGIYPVAPFVRTLQWFEALFGQFYFAVFIGQLVGLTMAGAKPPKSEAPPSRIHPEHDNVERSPPADH